MLVRRMKSSTGVAERTTCRTSNVSSWIRICRRSLTCWRSLTARTCQASKNSLRTLTLDQLKPRTTWISWTRSSTRADNSKRRLLVRSLRSCLRYSIESAWSGSIQSSTTLPNAFQVYSIRFPTKSSSDARRKSTYLIWSMAMLRSVFRISKIRFNAGKSGRKSMNVLPSLLIVNARKTRRNAHGNSTIIRSSLKWKHSFKDARNSLKSAKDNSSSQEKDPIIKSHSLEVQSDLKSRTFLKK